jgi:hypothetical protein
MAFSQVVKDARPNGRPRELIEASTDEPQRLDTLRAEFESLAAPYYFGNMVRQEYLLIRAKAAADCRAQR